MLRSRKIISLSPNNRVFSMVELRYLPQTMTELTDADDIKNMSKMIDLLEDNDDVQNVYHNWLES
jgi:transcriptional/translational regulatory protein YebC/TACO1